MYNFIILNTITIPSISTYSKLLKRLYNSGIYSFSVLPSSFPFVLVTIVSFNVLPLDSSKGRRESYRLSIEAHEMMNMPQLTLL